MIYVKADGTAYYVHDGGDPSGSTETDTFTYEVSDESNASTQTITVTVTGVDDTNPTVVAESVSIEVGSTTSFDGVGSNANKLLANDTDDVGVTAIASVNGVAFASLTDSANSTYASGSGFKQVATGLGTLYIQSDGTAHYVHTVDSTDNEVFTYTVTDAAGNESVGTTLTLTVSDGVAPANLSAKTPAINEGGTTDNLQLLNGVTDESSVTISRVQIGSGSLAALPTAESSGTYIGFSKIYRKPR